ncbi:MAG TPA: hypothetical protein VEA37_14730, partial [Flavobacterium sp.]|nr:hypothetical protein [Flavobacterium sp.]
QTRTVKGFAFGFVPINENISNWNCDPAGPQVSYNTCNFMYKAPVTSVNPNDSLEINVPTSSLGTNLAGTTQYKVVPVVVFDDIPGITADPPLVADFAARQALTITWDTSVAVGETVAVPKAAEVEVSSFADDTNESAVKSLAEGLQSVIATVVNIILTIIATIVHFFVWLVMQLVVVVLTALLGGVDFFKAANIPDFVKVGWVYVRDLMNSFFIIALIATGVMMMINKGSYRLVNIIRDLIYVAIIINFSLLLGQLVLGLAQVLINTFIDPNLIKDLVINVRVGAAATFFNTVESEGYLAAARNLTGFSYTAQLVFTIFFEITMVIVLGMLAVLLVVRLVTVWLMLIISPVPYMMDTFFSGVGKKAGKDA